MSVDPIRRTVQVDAPVEDAWVVFTARIASWWPVKTHSLGKELVDTLVLEPRVGGRFYEVREDGSQVDWGTVLTWEPPARLAVEWTVASDDGEQPTEWEVRFSAENGGTRVDLEHRGWERLSVDGDERRASYDGGWPGVLAAFAEIPVRTG
jgi:uncharacterized protein YndB with AHSA1/START domain